jgi:hypothetical protein
VIDLREAQAPGLPCRGMRGRAALDRSARGGASEPRSACALGLSRPRADCGNPTSHGCRTLLPAPVLIPRALNKFAAHLAKLESIDLPQRSWGHPFIFSRRSNWLAPAQPGAPVHFPSTTVPESLRSIHPRGGWRTFFAVLQSPTQTEHIGSSSERAEDLAPNKCSGREYCRCDARTAKAIEPE